MDQTRLKPLTEGLGVADVIDAMTQMFAHRAHVIGLDSPDPGRILFGPAATIGFMPVRKDLMDPRRHRRCLSWQATGIPILP